MRKVRNEETVLQKLKCLQKQKAQGGSHAMDARSCMQHGKNPCKTEADGIGQDNLEEDDSRGAHA